MVALMGPQGGKGVLILSDSLNHASIVEGVKQCGATVKPFAHNDMPDLQRMLHTATTKGQAAFAKEGQAAFAKEKAAGAAQSSSSPAATAAVVPWRKIIVVVEGIYSMEGEFCNLPEVVALKKKYGAYVYLDEAYLDEAHSDQRVAGRWLEPACCVLVGWCCCACLKNAGGSVVAVIVRSDEGPSGRCRFRSWHVLEF